MDLDAILKQLDWSQADLARALDISDGHVADMKSGRRKISIKVAAKLAHWTKNPKILEAAIRERTAA